MQGGPRSATTAGARTSPRAAEPVREGRRLPGQPAVQRGAACARTARTRRGDQRQAGGDPVASSGPLQCRDRCGDDQQKLQRPHRRARCGPARPAWSPSPATKSAAARAGPPAAWTATSSARTRSTRRRPARPRTRRPAPPARRLRPAARPTAAEPSFSLHAPAIESRARMKVILFGATGMVGQGVLRECLLAPDVEVVLAIGRAPSGKADVPSCVSWCARTCSTTATSRGS